MAIDNDPKFFQDDSEGDHGMEDMLTYWLSWSLRLAADNNEYCKDKPKLKQHCRFMLFELLNINNYSHICVHEVKIKKEWKRIDLIAEIYIERDGKKERHILMMENKAYTFMSKIQRDEYPLKVIEKYGDPIKEHYFLHPVLLSCFERNKRDIEKLNRLVSYCSEGTSEYKWRVMSIEDIIYTRETDTESELYNTFWIKDWYKKNK